MGRKIKITSKINRPLGLDFPEYHYTRIFNNEGQTHIIDKDILDQIMYYPGVMTAFQDGLLELEDEEARIEYGLEVKDDNGEILVAPISLSSEDIFNKLTELSLSELKKFVDDLPKEQQQRFVDVAIEKGYMDYAKNAYFRRLTGRDIIKTIEMTREEPEEEE